MKILITGSAGFIGFHTAKFFLKKGYQVLGIDNLNRYYDINLKKARNKILLGFKNYTFKKININSFKKVEKIFKKNQFDLVIHLAAQAGVRYSLKNPSVYIDTNLRKTLSLYNAWISKGTDSFTISISGVIPPPPLTALPFFV